MFGYNDIKFLKDFVKLKCCIQYDQMSSNAFISLKDEHKKFKLQRYIFIVFSISDNDINFVETRCDFIPLTKTF